MTDMASPATPEPKGNRTGKIVLHGIAYVATFIVGITIGFVAQTDDDTPDTVAGAETDTPEPAAETQDDEPAEAPATVIEEPDYYVPVPKDFALDVKTLGKECFGSAGCNVTFRITVTTLAMEEFDPAATHELTYEVKGGEQEYINTLTISGDQYSTDEEERISTTGESTELSAVVLDVSER